MFSDDFRAKLQELFPDDKDLHDGANEANIALVHDLLTRHHRKASDSLSALFREPAFLQAVASES